MKNLLSFLFIILFLVLVPLTSFAASNSTSKNKKRLIIQGIHPLLAPREARTIPAARAHVSGIERGEFVDRRAVEQAVRDLQNVRNQSATLYRKLKKLRQASAEQETLQDTIELTRDFEERLTNPAKDVSVNDTLHTIRDAGLSSVFESVQKKVEPLLKQEKPFLFRLFE